MGHEWEVVSLGPHEYILDEANGKKNDVHRCKRCWQITVSDRGEPPRLRWVEDCETHIVKSVMKS